MSRCPDDGTPLTPAGDGLECGRCRGFAVAAHALAIAQSLRLETDPHSGAFARTRKCPECDAPMAPWRLGQLKAWVERCPSCEVFWLDAQDRKTAVLLQRQTSRQAAWASLPAEERRQAAGAVAEAAATPADDDELHPVQVVLSWLGLPIVARTEGDHPPIATVLLCSLLIVLFLFEQVTGDPSLSDEALGYDSATSGLFSAFTANMAHAGWAHLLGNTWFLFAFGAAVEQKVPRGPMLFAFFGLGPLTILLQGVFSPGVIVVGASGAVAVLMGMSFVLQPRARVLVSLTMLLTPVVAGAWVLHRWFEGDQLKPPSLTVPLWLYGVGEVALQAFMLSVGVPGVAWLAHLAGLGLGVGVGFGARRLWPVNPRS